jgi:NAD(P)-dependent dehydrogenase (short-subunit alcohol dehydrogenase family)
MRGFVHAGGILQDATVPNMTHAQCQAVFAPKLTGLHNMEQTNMHSAPVGAIVLFSSIASLLGGVGQANYTAANAALDASAAAQQAQGVAGSKIGRAHV